jgi:hypothetical protein
MGFSVSGESNEHLLMVTNKNPADLLQRICQSPELLEINELDKKDSTQVCDTGHRLYESVRS